MPRNTYYKRLRDDEYYDKITIEVVPRYKTSELSGDEWRISAVMRFWRKGKVVFERSFSKMEVAASALPWFFRTASEGDKESGFDFYDSEREGICFQPGCQDKATHEVALKSEYSDDGSFSRELKGNDTPIIRRRFCEKHKDRGDCGLEDSDANHVAIKVESVVGNEGTNVS